MTNADKIAFIVDENYSDMDPAALAAPKTFDGPVLRFRPNRVLNFLLAQAAAGSKCNMNELWIFACNAGVYRDEMQEFYRLIGYSLSGYMEIGFTRLKKRPAARTTGRR